MLKRIKLLTGIKLCNLLGINEARFTKDSAKRNRAILLICIYAFLALSIIASVVSTGIMLVSVGAGEALLTILFTAASGMVLLFTMFKAGSLIFDMKSYELLVSFPVTTAEIVISRFLSMYVSNLILSLVFILPGLAVYAVALQPSALFYVYSLIGALFTPLIPITLASALGGLTTAIGSRMKHKSIATSIITLIFVFAILGVSTVSPTMISLDGFDEEALCQLMSSVTEQIGNVYVPSTLLCQSIATGEITGLLLFCGISLGLFAVVVFILQSFFSKICMAINASSAKNNYKMQALRTSSPLRAMWRREMKHYFSSSLYVSNTMVGYILMVILSITALVVGAGKVDEMLGMPGITGKAYPAVLAMLAVIMPTTASAVSLEGKQWWIAQTLPVSSRNVWNSKILVNITVAAPFWLISGVLSCIALRPTLLQAVWIFVIPAVYIVFSSVAGLTVNLKFPVMSWDSDVVVIKQSTAALLAMLVDVVSVVPVLVCSFLLDESAINIALPVVAAVILAITVVIMHVNSKIDIRSISE